MNVECYKPSEVPDNVRAFWTECAARMDRMLVLLRSPGWLELLVDGDDAKGVVAVVRRDDGACQAVLPLLFRSWTMNYAIAGRSLVRHALPAFRVCGGTVIEDGISGSDLNRAFTQLVEQFPDNEAFWFDLVTDEKRLDLIRSGGRDGFFCYQPHAGIPHYRLVLPATEEECMDLRSRKSRKRLDEKERALARDVGSELEVVEIRSESDWAPYTSCIEDLMRRTWQARVLGHELDMEEQHKVAARGWLRSFLLLAGDDAIAFVLCYQGMDTLFYEFLGYDQSYAKYSPGTVLLYKVLALLYRRDTPRYVDFGEGEAAYKKEIANDVSTARAVLVVRSGLRHRFRFGCLTMIRGLDRMLRGLAARTSLGQRAARKARKSDA